MTDNGPSLTEVNAVIKRLDKDVVNRIAAGEVIQRPFNAVKEMLENSLDAGATSIQITTKEGGLKFLQIQDNGQGIRREDMDIVCERFTTSKLEKFEDLQRISTFGFRGEALASISHVALLTLVTRTADSKCAYKCSYVDGKPKDTPKPCAGNHGTQIIVEDLFYNMAVRRKAMKTGSEEHAKICDVVKKYAIHNSRVGFSVKKQNDTNLDVKTPQASSVVDNIKLLYGMPISRELLELNYENPDLKLVAKGYLTNANYSNKQPVYIFFINDRLVDCLPLRKAIEQAYALYLPKGSHPFVYLSLNMPGQSIDVNVHPTKQEVRFLHEDVIVEKLQKAVDNKLVGSSESRTFYTQTLLPQAKLDLTVSGLTQADKLLEDSTGDSPKIHPRKLVRTDCKERTLDAFAYRKNSEEKTESPVAGCSTASANADIPLKKSKMTMTNTPRANQFNYASICALRSEVEANCHPALRDMFKEHKFVGCVDQKQTLLQHLTKLYIVDMEKLGSELFYQIMLYDFGNYGYLKLTSSVTVYDLALLALDDGSAGWTADDGAKEELAANAQALLVSKTEMLDEYFSIKLQQDGTLISIPLLLDSYVPALEGLPLYILRLATEVDWDKEKECFKKICIETSRFYSRPNSEQPLMDTENAEAVADQSAAKEPHWKSMVEHALMPAFRASFQPPRSCLEDSSILQIADLPDLYKVFERC